MMFIKGVCGNCTGGSTGLAYDYGEDCAGECFGGGSFDKCNFCQDKDEHTDVIDCNGDCYGTATNNS